jgi:histidinol-phosphate aminotransferase
MNILLLMSKLFCNAAMLAMSHVMTQIAPLPLPWIDAIKAYVPGKATAPGGKVAIKLSANESPLGPSPHAIAAMQAAVAGAHRYPEGSSQSLRNKLAALHGLEAERIICGTGSDELLHLMAQAYATCGDEVLFNQYGFSVYPIAAMRAGATPVEAAAKDYGADVDALLAAVTPRTRVVFLANPNNPTGTIVPRQDILRLHAGLRPDILLVLDAAYAEFVDGADYECGLTLARTAANVITTRTFSKIYGLGGLRVGWAYGPQAVIDILNKIRGPFNVSIEGIAGAAAAVEDQAWVEKTKAHNAQWRTWLSDALSQYGNKGVRVIPSQCNFLLVEFPQDAAHNAGAANQHLISDGYIVRWLPNQGLGNCLRITIGTADEMHGLMDSLRTFLDAA